MKIKTNNVLNSLMLMAVLSASTASAQNYPSRNLRYLVGGSAGSGTDTIGRIVAGGLTEVMGQQVIVENRPGAGGNIVADIAAKAPPDGYLMFQTTVAYAVYVTLYTHLNYDLVKDFAPVTQLATGPYMVVVHPSLPVKTIADLVKVAKAKPGAMNYASAGSGTPTFMGMELFKSQAGIDLAHVPYKGGGPALTSVMSGETSVYFAPVAPTLPQVHQGRLHALAVTSAKRLTLTPDLPTIAESGYPNYESGSWYGLLVPAKTPRDVINTLRNAAVTAHNKPETNNRLADLGYITVGDSPEAFGAYIKLEIDRLGKVVKALNLKPE